MILSLESRRRPAGKGEAWTADHGDPSLGLRRSERGAARLGRQGGSFFLLRAFGLCSPPVWRKSPVPGPGRIGDSSHEVRLGSTQCTRETASGDRKRVVRGGGALSGIIVRTRGSNRRRKSASTLSDMPVPALPA